MNTIVYTLHVFTIRCDTVLRSGFSEITLNEIIIIIIIMNMILVDMYVGSCVAVDWLLNERATARSCKPPNKKCKKNK